MISNYKIYKQSRGHCANANLRGIYYFWTGVSKKEREIAELTCSNKHGCTIEGIIRGSKKLGLIPFGIKEGGDLELLRKCVRLNIPPMVCYFDPYYQEEHWATLLNINGRATIADTQIGKLKEFDLSEFYSFWTSIKRKKILNHTAIIVPNDKEIIHSLLWLNNYKLI